MVTRRNFIKRAVVGSAALSFGGVLEGFSAKSYNVILKMILFAMFQYQ